MTEEQIINRYVRGWTSLEQYRAELVEFYNQEDAKDNAAREALVIRQLERFRAPYFAEVDGEL